MRSSARRMKLLPTTWFVCKKCVHCACNYVLWTLWLLLGVLLIFQIKIGLSRELQIPAWLVHRIENKHAARGLVSHFGSVTLDSGGRMLLGDARIYSTLYPEPLLTARTIEVVLNPWAALGGNFGASEVRMQGVELHLPPILSPSGQDEAVLTDSSLVLRVHDRDLTIEQLNARSGSLTIAVRGTVTIPRGENARDLEPREIIDHILATYFQSARQLAKHLPQIAWLDQPHLDVSLSSHPLRAAVARCQLTALGARLPGSLLPGGVSAETIEVGPVSLQASLPLLNQQTWATRIQASTRYLATPADLRADDVRLSLLTTFQNGWKLLPRSLDLAAGSLSFENLTASTVAAQISGNYPQLRASVSARIFDDSWDLKAAGDLSTKFGEVTASSRLTPAIFEFARQRSGRDLAAILKPAAPPSFNIRAAFDSGWKLSRAEGSLSSGAVNAYRVALDKTSADFALVGTDLRVDRIFLKTGESHARGSYRMDTRTFDFRILLEGALRPPAIGGWFSDWWPNFWSHFDFSASAPPRASVEVAGRWGKPYDTLVFVQAEADRPKIRTVSFDEVRTTLFIRPHFYDGLELFAKRDAGTARGTFTRSLDLQKNALRYNSFDVITDIDPREGARIFGKVGNNIVEPFVFQRPPRFKISGRLDGPAAAGGAHEHAVVDIDSTGPFTFFGFRLSDLTARATLNDDDLKISQLKVGFANGTVTGRASLSGKDAERRLGFDATLENGSLGTAIQTLEEFGAHRKNLPPPPRSKFQERLAPGLLGLRLSADGNYQDPYSFKGEGSGEISGAELAQINLLGGLSDVLRSVRLNFTSLRLTSAQTNFKLQGRQLDFSELKITGPSAAIDLTGLYRLDLQQMDFNARVSPFELSRNPLASAVDLVLTPFTSILELKLTGSLDHPNWRFAYGPSSLLRSITGKKDILENAPNPPAPLSIDLLPPPSLRRR
jgi:hypothetical protein